MAKKKSIGIDDPQAHFNRELSWLHFARRVLELAEDGATPLLERVKFAGIMGMLYADLDADQRIHVEQYFVESIQPILTPFPFVSNLSLNIAASVKRGGKKRPKFIHIKVPANRPRWVPLPTGGCVPLEQVIAHNLVSLQAEGYPELRYPPHALVDHPRMGGVGPR